MADSIFTTQSSGGNISTETRKKTLKGGVAQQKILVFPNKLGEYGGGDDVAYMMIQIYDRNSAKKLRDDVKFAVSVQQDGVATTTADFGSKVSKKNNTEASFNDRALKSGKNVRSKTDDEFIADKIEQAGAEDLTFLVDKDISLLDRVIAIPMPNQINHGLNAAINTKSASALDAAFSDPGGAAKAIAKKVPGAILGAGSSAAQGALGATTAGGIRGAAANVAGDVLGGLQKGTENYLDTALRNSGYIENDRREMWFDGMDFRNFTFSYSFSPRNENEANKLQAIIETLRFYMLPTYDEGKFFLLQPAEFEMKFMIGSNENKSIPKIDRCLLKSCNVNYSPRDKWIVLKDGNGFPPEITIELQFVEKQLMFREKVYSATANQLVGGF